MALSENIHRHTTTSRAESAVVSRAAAGRRTGDEQVAVWLAEYASVKADTRTTAVTRRRMALQERITTHYAGLVESVARRFLRSGEPVEDLVQEGYLGLLCALDNYDSSKKVKFSTYATYFVAGAMRHCLRDRGKIIKEPAWLQELNGRIARVSDSLMQQLGRAPTAGEIAHILNLSEDAVEEVLSARQVFQVASFGNEEDGVGVVDPDKIRSDRYVTFHLPIEDRILIEGAVEKLKALEQKVLYEFFYKDMSQTEIARKFGISCNYAAHILKNSTKKVRRILGEAEVRDRTRNREVSIVDSLTGLYTAAHIQQRLEEEISRASRGHYPLAVAVIELRDLPDDSRRCAGILSAYGSVIRMNVRRVDIAGRLPSGHGFVVLLPHSGVTSSVVLERLTDALRVIAQDTGERLALHTGCAVFPEQGRSAAALLAAARGEGDPEVTLARAA